MILIGLPADDQQEEVYKAAKSPGDYLGAATDELQARKHKDTKWKSIKNMKWLKKLFEMKECSKIIQVP